MSRPRCKYCNKVLKIKRGRGRPKQYCDEKCRKRYNLMSPCEECGNPSWNRLCLTCANAHLIFNKRYAQAVLWNDILDLRQEGLLNYEIAAVLKRSVLQVQSSVTRMRQAGLDVPVSTYDRSKWMDDWYKLQVARKVFRQRSL